MFGQPCRTDADIENSKISHEAGALNMAPVSDPSPVVPGRETVRFIAYRRACRTSYRIFVGSTQAMMRQHTSRDVYSAVQYSIRKAGRRRQEAITICRAWERGNQSQHARQFQWTLPMVPLLPSPTPSRCRLPRLLVRTPHGRLPIQFCLSQLPAETGSLLSYFSLVLNEFHTDPLRSSGYPIT